MATHDTGYRLLFSHPEMVADLLRGFVHEDWVGELDFSTLERVETQQVSDGLEERRSDLVWRLRWGERWLYVYLVLEFQSSSDRWMAVRLLTYVGLLYQQLIRSQQLEDGRLPPVVPIVVYNGESPWRGATCLQDLIQPVPPALGRYSPGIEYLLLDENRYDPQALSAMPNLTAALIRLEQSRAPEDLMEVIGALVEWLKEPGQRSLRRAFAVWLGRVLLPARLPGVEVPQLDELSEVKVMLAERVKEWTRTWEQQGIEKGIEKGMRKGRLEAERTMLLRQTRRRFGDACAERIERLVAGIDDPACLLDLGDGLIEAEDAGAFVEQVVKATKAHGE